MEFDLGGEAVTLLQFTQLNTSDTLPEYYETEVYADAHVASSDPWDSFYDVHHDQQPGFRDGVPDIMSGISSMEVSAIPSANPPPVPTTVQQPSAYFRSADSYGMHSTEPQVSPSYFLNQQQQYCSNDYVPPQAVSPPVSAITSGGYDSPPVGLDGIELLLNDSMGSADLGPQPVRMPRLGEEPPRKESAYSSNLLVSQFGMRCASHSPSDMMRNKSDTLKATRRIRNMSSKISRNTIKRASSPMFPDYSTPLSSLGLSRHPSISSLSSSTKSDPFSNIATSVRSDPGPYQIQHSMSGDFAVEHSPVTSQENSPKFVYSSTGSLSQNVPVSDDTSSRACIELAMPVKFAKKITDLDKKILRLQAERSKIIEKVHTRSNEDNFDNYLLAEKSSENGRVHLYICPLGIHALDEPLYEEANMILRKVGGLFFDYQSAVNDLRNICCKGMVHLPDISTCFAYIKSLLNENQKTNLVISTGGLYKIQLDVNPNKSQTDVIVPTKFLESLGVANEVIRCAQHITKVYQTIQMQLRQVRQMAAAKLDQCDSICQKVGIMDRERRTHIKSVLDGNCTIMASAERVWPQYYQIALNTIKTITACIHPSV